MSHSIPGSPAQTPQDEPGRQADAVRICIFDADGVLIPPWGFNAYLAREYPTIAAQTRPFFTGPFADCLVGKADLYTVLGPYLQEWEWPHTVEEFVARWFESEHHLNPDVVALIETLRGRGVPCYLATNQERRRGAYMAEQMGLGKLFDGLFVSAHLGVAKPHPQFFHQITQALGVSPQTIGFWDDSPANVEAAQAAGWHATLYAGVEPLTHQIAHLLAPPD